MEKEKEVYNDLYEVVERGTYFNAYVLNENKERRNEVEDIKTAMSELDKLDELDKIDNLNTPENLQNQYSDLSDEEIKEVYKDLYEKQENLYLYKIDNNIFDDKILSQQYLDNTQKLNYLEENIVDTTTKYELQANVKHNLLNDNRYDQKIEESNQQYQQLTQQLYEAKTENLNKDDIEKDLFDSMADKKLYSHNQKFLNNHKEELKDINEKEQNRLNNRKEQSKSLENLYSKDIMWKIVEEQEHNKQFLTKNGDDLLDARTNANNINSQLSSNNTMQYSRSQMTRNSTYNNSYSSLNRSEEISKANRNQNEQQEYRDKREEQSEEKQQKQQKGQQR